MNDNNIVAMPYKPEGSYFKTRYVIMNKETGEVLDDAQGYGYGSALKAYAAYEWKTRDRSKDKEKQAKEKAIRTWMKQHRAFVNALDQLAFDIVSGRDPDEKITTKTVRDLLAELNIETEFEPKDILRVWGK